MDLIERHRRFWTRDSVDRPLVGASREGVYFLQPFVDLGIGDGPLAAEAIPNPAAFLQPYFDKTLRGDPLDGDLYWVAKPPRALPWMEAMIGCGVYVSTSSQAMTALEPAELPDLDQIDLESNPWQRLMTEFTIALADRYGQSFPVGQTLMRGPSDMMAALLGQSFYTGLHDSPEWSRRLARRCTDLWIEALQLQYRHIPPYQGGYVSGIMGIWAPGPVAVFQEDAAGFISEPMYREFFLECDAAIADAFEYSLLHLHSASLQVLDPVLEIASLAAVNVVVDPLGPHLDRLIPDLQRIQAAGKALHLHGDLTAGEVERAQNALSPEGLCIWIVRDK